MAQTDAHEHEGGTTNLRHEQSSNLMCTVKGQEECAESREAAKVHARRIPRGEGTNQGGGASWIGQDKVEGKRGEERELQSHEQHCF